MLALRHSHPTATQLTASHALKIFTNSADQGGTAQQRGRVGACHPAAPGSILGVPKNFSKFLMLLRLIDSASQSVEKLENVDQTIQYQLVASQYYKKPVLIIALQFEELRCCILILPEYFKSEKIIQSGFKPSLINKTYLPFTEIWLVTEVLNL